MSARILTLTGAPHPQALVQSVDAATGVCIFAWLDSAGERVDSGGSVARVTVSWEPGELPDERVYIAPTDAELAAAIANPPAPPAPVIVLSPLEILSRMTPAEEAALNASTELAVQIVKTRLGAASEIRSDDPRTDQGKAILIAYGILTTERAAAIFA